MAAALKVRTIKTPTGYRTHVINGAGITEYTSVVEEYRQDAEASADQYIARIHGTARVTYCGDL